MFHFIHVAGRETQTKRFEPFRIKLVQRQQGVRLNGKIPVRRRDEVPSQCDPPDFSRELPLLKRWWIGWTERRIRALIRDMASPSSIRCQWLSRLLNHLLIDG